MHEIWEKWTPREVENSSEIFSLETLQYDQDGLDLILTSDDLTTKLIAHFDEHLCFRVIDEGDFLRTQNQIKTISGWTFFKVKQSSFLRWFHEESYNIRKSDDIIHYAFVTPDDIVDILSLAPPKVMLGDEKS